MKHANPLNNLKSSCTVSSDMFFEEYAGTFQFNKGRSIHRWYPYIEGYSQDFVASVIKEYGDASSKIYDPFAGVGTTPLTASHMFLTSLISEINPFLRLVCEVKVNTVRKILHQFKQKRNPLRRDLEFFNSLSDEDFRSYEWEEVISDCFPKRKYFDKVVLQKIGFLKQRIVRIKEEDPDIAKLYLLALASILVQVSRMKRATDLRYKTPKEVKQTDSEVFRLFKNKLNSIYEDLKSVENPHLLGKMRVLSNDAKVVKNTEEKADLIITSPSYLNGTNYFRNTKLELWILDFIKNEVDLKAFRRVTIPSGINYISKERDKPIDFECVQQIATKLDKVAYDPRIPKMIRCYFSDMYLSLQNMLHILQNGGYAFIDIGDSIFCGVHVKTDEILKELAVQEAGFNFKKMQLLRRRRSYRGGPYNGYPLRESLIILQKPRPKYVTKTAPAVSPKGDLLQLRIKQFEREKPHKDQPFNKRNWGHYLHSLCSYQSKLKPAIAYFLIKYFTKKGQRILDPFGGVGTISFEACQAGRIGLTNDINEVAYYVALPKVKQFEKKQVLDELQNLQKFIKENLVKKSNASNVTLKINRDIKEYYHPDTFREILTARKYYLQSPPTGPSRALVLASLLHILHGNRPYALSRRSHGITPFAPSGLYQYKPLTVKLREKVERTLETHYSPEYMEGESYRSSIFNLDARIKKIDAIITSPPFLASTRFHTNNWIRQWFCGWEEDDFKTRKNDFLEVLQAKGLSIYEKIFEILYQILSKKGLCVMHLGTTSSHDMGKELIKYSYKFFKPIDLIYEHVGECQKHGIRDQGRTKRHQFLFLRRFD